MRFQYLFNMSFVVSSLQLFFFSFFLCPTLVFSAHPLITDDAGTLGQGTVQLEINGEYGYDKEEGTVTKTTESAAALCYGLSDSVDLIAGVPYLHARTTDDTSIISEKGLSDTSLEVKWRFYEHDDLSFTIKPGFSLPTGDDEKGLGSGKVAYSIFTIVSKEIDPWAFHLNLGYVRNENKFDEEKDIWHVSLASTFMVSEALTAVANLGMERSTDPFAGDDPAFALVGLIYAVSDELELDCGFKFGLNDAETDSTVLAGITWRF
jgi:hypothetical protein